MIFGHATPPAPLKDWTVSNVSCVHCGTLSGPCSALSGIAVYVEGVSSAWVESIQSVDDK